MKKRVVALFAALVSVFGFGLANSGSAVALTNPHSLLGYNGCGTPKGNSTANGTIVTLWECTGSNLQQWSYQDAHIVHSASGKCLTPQGNASGTNGTVLTLWTCDWSSTSPQRFVQATNPLRVYTQWGGKCITNKGGSLSNGTYLTLWTCASGNVPEQTWDA
ncbi:RICIN domain-containing protein [Streptomyces sp. NPDC096339]|uniref:RICIN domain-containing protein n=1 Tax=Streptomyces sp. NPDC096339 TaxID=3366086 RepID=UPI0037FDAD16